MLSETIPFQLIIIIKKPFQPGMSWRVERRQDTGHFTKKNLINLAITISSEIYIYIYILHSVHVSHSTDACTFYFVNSVFKLSTSYLCHSTSAILFRIDTSRCHCCTENELGQIIEQRDLRLWRWVPVCLWKQLEIRHFEFSHWPRDRTEHYYLTSADFSEPLPICDNSEQLPQKIY